MSPCEFTAPVINASELIARQSEKFIFSSTCSNYGKMDDPESYVYEDSKLAPVSLYAELKVKFEKYMLNEMPKANNFSPT